VANRTCPRCHTEISAALAAAYSNGLECPNCKERLEVVSGPRTISSAAGFAAAAAAWRLTNGSSGALGGVLPIVYVVIAFGVVSSLVLMFTASLHAAPAVPVPIAEAAHGGHASGVHGGTHH
jgi:VIT1/CCC1 family predicted Fe2+/Mn2+ transporter